MDGAPFCVFVAYLGLAVALTAWLCVAAILARRRGHGGGSTAPMEAPLLDTGASHPKDPVDCDIHGMPAGADFYQWYASRAQVPNVSLKDYNIQNRGVFVVWVVAVVLCCRFSTPRIDQTFSWNYMRAHWAYNLLLWVLWLAPNGLPLVFGPSFGGTDVGLVCIVSVASHVFYYSVVWGIMYFPQQFETLFRTRAGMLQVWEFYCFFAWAGQAVAIQAIMGLEYDEIGAWAHGNLEVFQIRDGIYANTFAVVLMWVLFLIGFGTKLSVFYDCGINTYFWYDTILRRPNAYFVQNGLYSIMSSPTYFLGYLDGFALAMLLAVKRQGSPLLMFVHMTVIYVWTNLNNHFIEQRSVRMLYGGHGAKVDIADPVCVTG